MGTPEMALEPMEVMISGANMPIPVPASPYSCQTRADGPWRKIMQDIGGNVPTGTANLMRDLLAQAATRETSLEGRFGSCSLHRGSLFVELVDGLLVVHF